MRTAKQGNKEFRTRNHFEKETIDLLSTCGLLIIENEYVTVFKY